MPEEFPVGSASEKGFSLQECLLSQEAYFATLVNEDVSEASIRVVAVVSPSADAQITSP